MRQALLSDSVCLDVMGGCGIPDRVFTLDSEDLRRVLPGLDVQTSRPHRCHHGVASAETLVVYLCAAYRKAAPPWCQMTVTTTWNNVPGMKTGGALIQRDKVGNISPLSSRPHGQ